jgi:Transcription factor WhiB
MFIPAHGSSSLRLRQTRACAGVHLYHALHGAVHLAATAKAVCQACPVRASCLAFAVETRQDGIWGGTTFERHAVRNQASQRRLTGRTVSTGHA